tara:strand:- start:4 stop:663 length:660 start_codon:yes stop_codon:yes gene_type:complete
MPKKKKTGLHPGGLLPIRQPDPEIAPRRVFRTGRDYPQPTPRSLLKPLDKGRPIPKKPRRKLPPELRKRVEETTRGVRTRTPTKAEEARIKAINDQIAADQARRGVTTNPRVPKSVLSQLVGADLTGKRRGTDDAFMKKQQKMLEEFFRKNRKPRSVGRTARASGPGRRNRRAPVAQPVRAFQPSRGINAAQPYSYANGGLTKSTTELKTGLKKAKDSK